MKGSLQYSPISVKPRRVKYSIYGQKLETVVGYLKDGAIDLAPRFQRGRVWKLKDRQGLIKNILQGKPVPAIFLYKTPIGSKNTFVILDGKQRLETILLYIASQRQDFQIPNWLDYISGAEDRRQQGFRAPTGITGKTLKDLSDEEMVKFRDYSVSIIEIEFDDDTTLQEIVELFVDINQTGVKVTRFEIVKSLYREDPLLNQVLALIAIFQRRGKDIFYKSKSTPFSKVLKQLDIVKRIGNTQTQFDVMRERLFEFAMYAATGMHRKPSQILKDYITRKGATPLYPKLNAKDMSLLQGVFSFLSKYSSEFKNTRLGSEQTHFYILATSLLDEIRNSDSAQWPDILSKSTVLKLVKLDALISRVDKHDNGEVKEYLSLSERQTTDVKKRQDREKLFRSILKSM